MLRVRSRLYIEPGEIELLADMAQREGRRLRRGRGSGLPRGLMLEQLSAELVKLLDGPRPPLYTIGPASCRQARMVARQLADGLRERRLKYGDIHAREPMMAAAPNKRASDTDTPGYNRPTALTLSNLHPPRCA